MGIYIFTSIYLIFFTIIELMSNKKTKLMKVFFFIISLTLILTSGLRYGLETDYWHYYNIYTGRTTVKALEIGFALFNKFFQFLGVNFYLYIMIVALLSLGLKIKVFKSLKYSFLITSLFYFRFFVLLELNALRQGMATALIIYGVYKWIKEENLKHFIVIELIATTFHASSALIFLIVLFKDKKISFNKTVFLFLGCILFRLFFVDELINFGAKYITVILSSSTNLVKGTQYIFNGQDKMTDFSFFSLARIIISFYSYYWLAKHSNNYEKCNALLNIYLIGSLFNIILMGFNTIDYRLAVVFYCCEGLLMSYSLESIKIIGKKKSQIMRLVCILLIMSCNIYSFIGTMNSSTTAIPYKSILSQKISLSVLN